MVKAKISAKNYVDARTAIYLHPSAPLQNSTQYRKHNGAYSIPGGTVATSRKEYSGAAAGMSGGSVNPAGGSVNPAGGSINPNGGSLNTAGSSGRTRYGGRGANAAGKEMNPTDVLFSYEAGRLPYTRATTIKRSKHMRPDINTGQQAFKTQVRRKGALLIPPVLRKNKMAELAKSMSGTGIVDDAINAYQSYGNFIFRDHPEIAIASPAILGAIGAYQLGRAGWDGARHAYKKLRGGSFMDYVNNAATAINATNAAMDVAKRAPTIIDKVSEGWEWIKHNPGKAAVIGAAGIGAAIAPSASTMYQGLRNLTDVTLMRGSGRPNKKKLRKRQKKRT
jgi:hypothetical protein